MTSIYTSYRKVADMLAEVGFRFGDNYTEDEFNKAIDNIKPEPTFKNTWPSMAVHVVISRDDIVITNETIGSILYKYRDTATTVLQHENTVKNLIDKRNIILEINGHFIVECAQEHGMCNCSYICGTCDAQRSSRADRLKLLGRECRQCTQRVSNDNMYMSFAKMKDTLLALPVSVHFAENYTEVDFNAAIERVIEVGLNAQKWASKAVHPVISPDGSIIDTEPIAHILNRFRDWQTHRLPYETELFVRDRLDVYERVGHTIVDYYQKDKNARIYLYICGECGAHRSLSIDRLKVLDSRECQQCTQRLGENNVFMSLSKMKEMLVALPVDVRFIDNYTELDFNAAIDRVIESGRDSYKWPSKAVHTLVDPSGTIINTDTIGNILYKFRDWRTPRLPYETKAFLQDRQRIMDQTGRYILEYKYNNQNQRVYLYICGECGAHRQSCIVRLRQYTGHGCKECSRRLGENNAYTSFIKMKEILSTLSVPFRFPDHYTEDDFNTTIERVTDIGL